MKSILRRRPSPALVISIIALFVSLSGVSYGVATGFIDSREIKNNEIRSLDIRNNQVRSIDLRNNEMRGIDIRNSTVQGRDIALNTVTGEDLNESTLGKVPSATAADTATTATTAGRRQHAEGHPADDRAAGGRRPGDSYARHARSADSDRRLLDGRGRDAGRRALRQDHRGQLGVGRRAPSSAGDVTDDLEPGPRCRRTTSSTIMATGRPGRR